MPQTGSIYIDFSDKQLQSSWSDTSSKTAIFPVVFERPFLNPPVVMTAISGVDGGGDAITMFYVEPHAITALGFNLTCYVTRGPQMNSITVSWLAVEANG